MCRRLLGDVHLAEDVVQATFLVLVRKGRAIRRRERIAGWLHGVARRIARHAQLAEAVRRQREHRAAKQLGAVTCDDGTEELLHILDEEMQRLNERYRLPLLLCYLEGRTQEEAAQQLGWSLSTLRRRLERGRELLHARLLRRGATPASAMGALALAAGSARAGLSASVRRAILDAAATGGRSALISASVAALAATGLRIVSWVPALLSLVLVAALGGILAGAAWQGAPAVVAPLALDGEAGAAPNRAADQADQAEEAEQPVRRRSPDELRQDLGYRLEELTSPTAFPDAYWEPRRTKVLADVRALGALADLKDAFLLEEWINAVKLFARPALVELGQRIIGKLNTELQAPDAVRRLAAIDVIAELSKRWEHARQSEKVQLDPLLPLLVASTRDQEPAVSHAALSAVATSWSAEHAILDILKVALGDERREVRAGAGGALREFVQVGLERRRAGRRRYAPLEMRLDHKVLTAVLEMAAQSLRDTDAEVRRGCWTAVAGAVFAALDRVYDPMSARDLPRSVPGVKGEWDKELQMLEKQMHKEEAENKPIIAALVQLAPAWARDLDRPGLEQPAALDALLQTARWRRRWLARLGGFPAAPSNPEDPLRAILKAAEPSIADGLSGGDPAVRYRALDTMETLGPELAMTAALAAVKNGDPFVRDGAARMVSRRAPDDADTVVPALTELLRDPVVDVRLTALRGLEGYGARARLAATAVQVLAEHGTRCQRVQAMRTLQALGRDACRAAIPILLASAAPAEDPELRIAAVAALGTAYPATDEVRAVLMRAARDPDLDVRRAAADALATR